MGGRASVAGFRNTSSETATPFGSRVCCLIPILFRKPSAFALIGAWESNHHRRLGGCRRKASGYMHNRKLSLAVPEHVGDLSEAHDLGGVKVFAIPGRTEHKPKARRREVTNCVLPVQGGWHSHKEHVLLLLLDECAIYTLP